MSWGVDIIVEHPDGYSTTIAVVDGHTYNLTPMWAKAGIFQTSRDLQGRNAGQLAPVLSAGLLDAVRNAKAYRQLDPPSGWGDYEGFLAILTRFTTLCWEHPTGRLEWNG